MEAIALAAIAGWLIGMVMGGLGMVAGAMIADWFEVDR